VIHFFGAPLSNGYSDAATGDFEFAVELAGKLDVFHLRLIEQTECFMFLLKCPSDRPSTVSAGCRKRSSAVDATHPHPGALESGLSRLILRISSRTFVATAGWNIGEVLMDNTNMDTSPYRSDCTNHVTTPRTGRSILGTLRESEVMQAVWKRGRCARWRPCMKLSRVSGTIIFALATIDGICDRHRPHPARVKSGVFYTRSSSIAIPCPTPTHMEAIA
jgi:hypothetical protein